MLRPIAVLYRRSFLVGGLAAAALLALPSGAALAKTKSAEKTNDGAETKSKIRDAESSSIGTTFELGLDHAPYPDGTGRYSDDTVMVFVPAYYRLPKDKRIDFVVHFHGHNSMAKDIIVSHKLREQLRDSRQNAILVVPQGPVNQPDGDFGKLMKKGGLGEMLAELRSVLATKKARTKLGEASIRGAKATGRVILSSHSGGYHAVALNLTGGGVSVREVYLFDSLYDDVAAYREWLTGDPKHRKLVSYYLAGKTLENSVQLADDLADAKVSVVRETEGKRATHGEMTKSRGVFLLGKASHYEACYAEHPFRECLRASCLHGMGGKSWLSAKSSPRET